MKLLNETVTLTCDNISNQDNTIVSTSIATTRSVVLIKSFYCAVITLSVTLEPGGVVLLQDHSRLC